MLTIYFSGWLAAVNLLRCWLLKPDLLFTRRNPETHLGEKLGHQMRVSMTSIHTGLIR